MKIFQQLLKQNPGHELSKVAFGLMHPNKCVQIFGGMFKRDSELCLKGVIHVPGDVR